MSEHPDDETDSDPFPPPNGEIDDTPIVSCTTCGREWDVSYELDELGVGNQALEQFALDHKRHTGHYPDDVTTWRADCLRCPEEVERLSGDAARRWARTHARHTRHAVEIRHSTDGEPTVVEPEDQ
ncbi:hypothetical protein [Halegenticoccus soli]|uniref:hypothetical protein n=1 Tax=Halegenticoccus soli TaxID=1985678 RepID=UPI000C6D83B7|nr:hypothetical protein [Halegenticoccus soli]